MALGGVMDFRGGLLITPWGYSSTPLAEAVAPHAPRVGEHAAEVLRGDPGLSSGEVENLLAAGAAFDKQQTKKRAKSRL